MIYDESLEEAVLGALMCDNSTVYRVITSIPRGIFYNPKNEEIYKAIVELYKNNEVIDILTVTAKIREFNTLEYVGGAYRITEVSNRVASSANIEYHIRILSELLLRREAIRISSKVNRLANKDDIDIFQLYDDTQTDFNDSLKNIIRDGFKPVDDIILELVKEQDNPTIQESISTGFYTIDHVTGGAKNSAYWIIGGRPGMGKTSFALNIMFNMCVINKIPCGFFSLEMPSKDLVTRMVSMASNISLEKLKKGTLSEKEKIYRYNCQMAIANSPMYFFDLGGASIDEIHAQASIMKNKYNIKAIFIDYVQLIDGSKTKLSTYDRVSHVSRKLKIIAKSLGLCVIGLAQLNRDIEKRADKTPSLADLKESGQLEQDADLVMFLYRPEYYGVKEIEVDESELQQIPYGYGISSKGICKAIVEKNRDGERKSIYFNFDGRIQKFNEFKYKGNHE